MEMDFVLLSVLVIIWVIYVVICTVFILTQDSRDVAAHQHQDDRTSSLPQMNQKIVFLCPVRNAMEGLPATLRNLERVHRVFPQTRCVFVENDSTDGTREFIEKQFGGVLPTTILNGDVPASFSKVTYGKSGGRVSRMCLLRNQLLRAVDIQDQYFIMYDADLNTVLDIDMFCKAVLYLENNQDVNAVAPLFCKRTALCPFISMYYDTFAYQDKTTKNMSHAKRAFYLHTKLWDSKLEYMPVDSAFDCLAIYRYREDLP